MHVAAVVIVRCPACDNPVQAPVTVAGIDTVAGMLRTVRFYPADVNHRCDRPDRD